MESDKQCLQQASAADAMQSTSTVNASHNAFLNLRLEPFLSSSLMDLLDVLVYPAAPMSPSVPSTPPPTYEAPPPSYPPSDSWSLASFSSISLSDSASFMSTGDVVSIVMNDLFDEDNSVQRSNSPVGGLSGAGAPPELQNRLLLNLVVYELLTRQSTLSRSPSMASCLTRSSELLD
ncbi:hypothetical protein EV174_000157 [Coemansia sp. RSA 2320]|nr:hypothetical protein EV174_000157 [Coemansia sp. RSA 2320]